MLIEKSAWDSSFFNINIGKVNPGCFKEAAFSQETGPFNLIYIFEFPESALIPETYKYCPASIAVKVHYSKRIKHSDTID